jgi:hypothetical protein
MVLIWLSGSVLFRVFAADESIVVSPKGVELPTIVLQFVVFDEYGGR